METMLFIWIASVISQIQFVVGGICAVIAAYCVGKIVHAMFNSDYSYTKRYEPEQYEKAMEVWKFKWLKKPAFVIILLGLTVSIIPSEKTMYMMAAGFAGQKVVQSETADKVVKILNSKLDEYLVEIEEKTKK